MLKICCLSVRSLVVNEPPALSKYGVHTKILTQNIVTVVVTMFWWSAGEFYYRFTGTLQFSVDKLVFTCLLEAPFSD